MADVVRLSIIYETQQAAARLNGLNRQLGNTHTSTRRLSLAALSLAESMKTGEISSRGLERILHILGGRMGWVGLIIGLTTAALLLFKRHTDKTSDAVHQFNNKLRDTRRAVDDLLRADIKSPLQGEIEKITDAIGELDRQLGKERPNLWKRLTGDISLKALLGSAKRFVFGGTDPEKLRERAAQQAELDRLKPENLASAMSWRAFNQSNRISQFNTLTRGLISDDAAEKVKLLSDELKGLLEILPPESEQVQSVARSFRQAEDATRRLLRAETLMRNGLEEIAGAIEDFVIKGTVAFSDFLNNILRLLYRDFTGELIHGLVRSVYGGLPSVIPGGGGGGTQVLGDPGGGGGAMGSVTSNVNFTINTLDAQGVATFIQQHGATIAAEVTRQAGRSTGMRRMLRHG